MIIADMSMSLDGFIAGPNVSIHNGLGDGGERLHDWIFDGKSDEDVAAFMHDRFANTGAVLMGRTMLEVGIGPWGDEPVFHAPVFVVTHRPADAILKAGGTTFSFVTDGPEAALRLARETAGDRDIHVAGGAAIVRYYLRSGAIDELALHIVPIFLGAGTPMFDGSEVFVDLAAKGDVDENGVAHLRYKVKN
jgi:dihydrofolate reductase